MANCESIIFGQRGRKMALTKLWLGLAAAGCACAPVWLAAGQPKPQTLREFECYIQSVEARLDARKPFLLADSDATLDRQLISEKRVATIAANGANPHKLPGGHLYDWMGAVFIPGAKLDTLVRMLQDYDHRATYFPETISTSRLLCRTGTEHFSYTMRMKEPAVI